MGDVIAFPGVEVRKAPEEIRDERLREYLTIVFSSGEEKAVLVLNKEQASGLKNLIEAWLMKPKS